MLCLNSSESNVICLVLRGKLSGDKQNKKGDDKVQILMEAGATMDADEMGAGATITTRKRIPRTCTPLKFVFMIPIDAPHGKWGLSVVNHHRHMVQSPRPIQVMSVECICGLLIYILVNLTPVDI